jgi:ribosomal protein S18 acetylase RimI-like enzyme
VQAQDARHIADARELFLEYAQSLNFSLCFQGFEKELAGLAGDYGAPDGRLLLAYAGDCAAGCVALHKLEDGICEMKRLYVPPRFRGMRIGHALVERILADARNIGYTRMRLDTVEPVMGDAVRMYRALGFREIPPYRANPVAGALYMQLEL